MINVSNEFKELMQDRTDFHEEAEVTLLDGTVLEFDENDFTVNNNGFTDGAGENTLPLGVAVGRTTQIELWNGDEHLNVYDFFGAEIKLKLTFRLSETVEKVNIGTFTVAQNPSTLGDTVIIQANDAMYRADKDYSTTLSFPATAGAVFRDACTSCNIPYETASFLNDDFMISQSPAGEGVTYREVLGWVAMLAGGNMRINRNGKAEVLTYDFSDLREENNAHRHDLTDWIGAPEVDTEDITITGIKTVVDDTDVICGDEGYVLIVENPLFAGQEQEAVDLIGAVLVGVSFRKFRADHVAYPLAEFMDQIKITDWRGRSYYSVITDISFSFFARSSFSNSAASAVRAGGTYTSPESKAVAKARELVYEERSARESAMAALNDMVQNAGGLYSTDIEQEDGSIIHYLHDKPSLGESANVIKVTSEAIGFSTDGGETYPFGLEISGDIITKILSAIGINADWINAGSLSVGRIDGLDDLLDSMRDEYGDFIDTVLQYMEFDPVNGLKIAAIGSAICSRLTNSAWQLLAAGKVVQQVDAEDGAQFSSLTLAAINEGDIPVLNLGNLQISVETDGSLTGRRK